jgi:hypothetical protein
VCDAKFFLSKGVVDLEMPGEFYGGTISLLKGHSLALVMPMKL